MPLRGCGPSERADLGAGNCADQVDHVVRGPHGDEKAHATLSATAGRPRRAPKPALRQESRIGGARRVKITTVSPVVEAVHGDITTLEVDAIVNAANSALTDGGGVNGAIHRAAGIAELRAACAELGGCEPGDAKSTPGFLLPARFIIHTVGPVWRGGFRGEAEVLASCYRRSLEVADQIGARSVAFPAISTGIYEYPQDAAARVAVDSVRFAYTDVEKVFLVAYDLGTYELYRRLLTITL
jgi:O-acetyl-ADP-ribose deacetylase (regulator of RNase III)